MTDALIYEFHPAVAEFHLALVSKLGAGAFDMDTKSQTYIGHFDKGVMVQVPLIDIVMADDVGQMQRLVAWAAERAKQ